MRNKSLGYAEPELLLSGIEFLDKFSSFYKLSTYPRLSDKQIEEVLERTYPDWEFIRKRKNLNFMVAGQDTYERLASTLGILTDVSDVDKLIADMDMFIAKLYHILMAFDKVECKKGAEVIDVLRGIQEITKGVRLFEPHLSEDFDVKIMLLAGTYLKYNDLIDTFFGMIETSTTRNLRKFAIYLTV